MELRLQLAFWSLLMCVYSPVHANVYWVKCSVRPGVFWFAEPFAAYGEMVNLRPPVAQQDSLTPYNLIACSQVSVVPPAGLIKWPLSSRNITGHCILCSLKINYVDAKSRCWFPLLLSLSYFRLVDWLIDCENIIAMFMVMSSKLNLIELDCSRVVALFFSLLRVLLVYQQCFIALRFVYPGRLSFVHS